MPTGNRRRTTQRRMDRHGAARLAMTEKNNVLLGRSQQRGTDTQRFGGSREPVVQCADSCAVVAGDGQVQGRFVAHESPRDH